jgi:rhamnulokinase
MDTKKYLAFDLGAESGRAVVGLVESNLVHYKEIYRFPNKSIELNSNLYWDVLYIWDNLLQGLRTCSKIYGKDINGIGIDSWGVDYCLIDVNGNLAGNAYNYRDSRTMGTLEIIDKILGKKQLYLKTGVQMLQINTLNQLIASKRMDDPVLTIADKLLFIGDFFHYCLSGVKVSEFTVASISQLYNNNTFQWDESIFESFDLPEGIIPEIVNAGTVIGPVKDEIAMETGLSQAKVIAPAVHDTASAVVSVPAVSGSGWAFLSSGTWSIIGLELDQPIIDEKSMAFNISNSGGVLGKTLYLKNVMGLWIIQQCKRYWNSNDLSLEYSDLVNMASKATFFSAFIDPDDICFLNAKDTPNEVIKFCRRTGQLVPDKQDIGTISRIIFESLAMKYRLVLEQLLEGSGRDVGALYIIGGGSKNELLNQFTANAIDRKVYVSSEEASSVGNIMMQAVGDGIYESLTEVRQIIKASFDVKEYSPVNQSQWEAQYNNFRNFITQ